MARADEIRAAFADQANWCVRLGSPFTARLCEALVAAFDPETEVGARVLAWPGDPSGGADAPALRLCGGLHALVHAGQAPDLAKYYPPASLPEIAALGGALTPILRNPALLAWLDSAPQTNEVGRSAILMTGLLAAAAQYPLPIVLYELGASAGLNLQLDRYSYDLGRLRTGARDSPLKLAPQWKGGPPPLAEIRIRGRRGVDLAPLEPIRDRERLLAYIWPDQARRLAQAEAALDIAGRAPPPVEAGDAADWIERNLADDGPPGVMRVVMHTVAYQYFPKAVQARVAARMARAGAAAPPDSPLAWLRFEKLPEEESYSLRLRLWPGEDRLLAWAHPHVSSVEYLD